MERAEKKQFIEDLRTNLADASLLVLVKPNGLTVGEVSKVRSEVREAGGAYKVVKNTLARLAVKDTPFESVINDIAGPIAFVYGADPVAPTKAIVEAAKKLEDKLEVVSGCMDGSYINSDQVIALSKLPSLPELQAKLLSVISAPAQKMVSVLNAPARQLAQVIDAYSKK